MLKRCMHMMRLSLLHEMSRNTYPSHTYNWALTLRKQVQARESAAPKSLSQEGEETLC